MQKRLIDNLVEGCIENIDASEIIYNGTLNNYGNVCNSCTIYIVLLYTYLCYQALVISKNW